MKMKVLKLGIKCRDNPTGLHGALTHWLVGLDQIIYYFFQPEGLSETCQPINKIVVEPERLDLGENAWEEVEVPLEILGSHVADQASGFNGTAIQLIQHPNGCFHVAIQPAGVVPKTGQPILPCEFDLRQCKGPAIPELSEEELAKSRREKPSPTGSLPARHRVGA